MASGRCYEPESSVPFYPFLEALATLYRLAPEGVRRLLPERWPDVQRLLPNQTPHQTSSIFEGQEEQQRLFWAVTGFIKPSHPTGRWRFCWTICIGLTRRRISICCNISRATREEIESLLLGTYRDVEVNRQHPLESALTDLSRERLLDEIEVRRLDRAGRAF